MEKNVIQDPASYRTTFYTLGPGQYNRRFPGNAILFVVGTNVAITINNSIVLPAISGTSLAINGNKNEIDLTSYKIDVPAGGLLFVSVKEDLGIEKIIIEEQEPVSHRQLRSRHESDK